MRLNLLNSVQLRDDQYNQCDQCAQCNQCNQCNPRNQCKQCNQHNHDSLKSWFAASCPRLEQPRTRTDSVIGDTLVMSAACNSTWRARVSSHDRSGLGWGDGGPLILASYKPNSLPFDYHPDPYAKDFRAPWAERARSSSVFPFWKAWGYGGVAFSATFEVLQFMSIRASSC